MAGFSISAPQSGYLATAAAAILIVSSLGLAGHLSLTDTSLGTLVPGILSCNPFVILISSLGLGGIVGMTAVSVTGIVTSSVLLLPFARHCINSASGKGAFVQVD